MNHIDVQAYEQGVAMVISPAIGIEAIQVILTPDQARQLAFALVEKSDEAEYPEAGRAA